MKHKKKILIMVLVLSAVALAATSVSWNVFRTVVATEATQLAAGTQKTAPVEATDGIIAIMGRRGVVAVRFKGTAAENLTLSWTLWAYKDIASPAEYIANGTATTGLTQTGGTNEFYADTITITDQQWYSTVDIVAGAPEAIIAGGGISKLVFDSHEYQFFNLIIRDIAGGGSEMATAGADFLNYEP